jgi:hypothetical protein
MDYGAVISESIDYTREALVGRWVRWLIFIVCSVPLALFPFVFDSTKLADGATFHWELVPWDQLAAIFIIGFLLSFILAGYLVRIYRGVTPPPGFDNWGSLYLDGIKIAIVGFIWFIPLILVVAFQIALIFYALTGGIGGSGGLFLALLLVTLVLEVILFVITICYSIVGNVRFSRTGSIREGLRFSAITETIRTIGWGNYLIALLVMFIIGFVYTLILMFVSAVLSMVPVFGLVIATIIQLAVMPFYSVFTARYLARVYDHGEPAGAAPAV